MSLLTLILSTAMAAECQPSNYNELVKCAESTSLEIKHSEQVHKAARELKNISSQWINPELEAESVSKGSDRSETSATLFFTLRLGGKGSALESEAQAELEKSTAERDLQVGMSRLQLMLSLYRLSQLKEEIHLGEESVETFNKIITQFEKRPARSPEQEVSLSVFKMAASDYQIRLTKLNSEQNRILQTLTALTELKTETILKNLPNSKQNWPALEQTSSEVSPQVKSAQAELKLADSQLRLAQAEAWPELKVGPSFKTVKDIGVSDTFVGFGLSMPLPIFSLNGGRKDYSREKVLAAKIDLEKTRLTANSIRNQLVKNYTDMVTVLESSLSSKVIQDKHSKIENLFFKGVVQSSLVIEAHRQIIELEERKNEAELSALDSLGQILILDNKFTEVIL